MATSDTNGSAPVIDAQSLRKEFGGTAVLRDLSLFVNAGEIFGLIGPSGSGKSTTIGLLCGHLRLSGGSATVLGEEPERFSQSVRQQIGYMPQTFNLYPDLTVEQNVAFVAGLYGMQEWRCGDRIRAALDLVELWEARDRPARAISGGMQRRLALAAALVHNPTLLFVDEPTANLDPILRAKLWKHFRSLCDDGKSILLTTQYIDEAEYCDRVGLMFGGTLIAEGRPDALRQQAFGGDIVDIVIEQPSPRYAEELARLSGVRGAETTPDKPLRVTVADADQAIPVLLATLESRGARVRSVAEYLPSFDEVFIKLIEKHGGRLPEAGQLKTSESAEV